MDAMNTRLEHFARYYNTYEEREEAFRESVLSVIPRKYAGPGLFWQDFRGISLDALIGLQADPIAYITSNPRDCLAFGTPWQVLAAALMNARRADEGISVTVASTAERFGLTENLYQPIRTLSGGETVKLALAKSWLAAAYSRRLSIASPFSWLSQNNTIYFERLIEHYAGCDIPLDLFALEGEDSIEPVAKHRIKAANGSRAIDFEVGFRDVGINLGSALSVMDARPAVARVDDIQTSLLSPCQIVGENGQGKTLVAKLLAGAISAEGRVSIGSKTSTGRARLIFQHVITQTLLRSFTSIAAAARSRTGLDGGTVYAEMGRAFSDFYSVEGGQMPLRACGEDHRVRTLLEVKTMLVAVRIAGRPPALILDEPDWGLSRPASVAFVLAVIRVAHARGIPVILISHKPWWDCLASSTLRVRKTMPGAGGDKDCKFHITLQRGRL